MEWRDEYKDKLITAEQAAKLINPGDVVVFTLVIHPHKLGEEIAKRANELHDVTVICHWTQDYPWLHPGLEASFNVKDAFPLRFTRERVRQKIIDWVPSIFGLGNQKRRTEFGRSSVYHNADKYLLRVTPPNKQGYCSFSYGPWYSPSALRTAKTVIAEIDPSLPWTYGDYVHMSEFDYVVGSPPAEPDGAAVFPVPPQDEYEKAQVIGSFAASLIKDGDVLQFGTGTISEAAMDFLQDKNDLGIDSEMMYPQMIDLIKQGIITGKNKNVDVGKHMTTAFWLYPGDPRNRVALDYIDTNPAFEFRDVSYICDVRRVASVNNMVAINSAIGIDLLGQLVIDHLGPTPIAGPGGQVEYCIGSHYSQGGRSITCLMSTARGGTVSRIVPQLEKGTLIEIPATFVDFLITEYGAVNLECKSRRERAEALISVAHPDFRPELKKAAKELFWP